MPRRGDLPLFIGVAEREGKGISNAELQRLIATELHRASVVSAMPRDAILRNDDINSFCHPEQSEGSRG